MLINRNITVGGHRTSIRLEPEFWAGLADIAQREQLSIDELCTEIDSGAGDLSRTAAIRIFITAYMAHLRRRAAEYLTPPLAAVAGAATASGSVQTYPTPSQKIRAFG